jgi:hypothetical protein
MDRWQSKTIICKGGLDLSEDALTQGTVNVGTAKILQNYEPSLEGGYGRILGYLPWDDDVVPGEGSVLGVKVALGNVFAARHSTSTGIDVYKSSGAGWTKINSPARTAGASKYRFIAYSMTTPCINICDGVGYSAKYDGTTYTLINGSGAPADPKYALQAKSRLFLSGYSSNTRAVSISAPNSDTSFSSGAGAIELICGDIVVGIRLFRETVYIFCENSIYKLTGSSASDFALSPVTTSIGCVSGDTIQEIGGDLLFLAPDGLRSLAATDRIGDIDLALQSRRIQPLIRDYIGSFSSDKFSSVVIRRKSQYRMFIFDTMTLDQTALYDDASVATYGSSIYGLRSEDNQAQGILGKLSDEALDGTGYEWATLLGINVFCADSEYTDGEETIVFGHPANGMVYRLEQGYDFDGRSVEYVYRTPQLTFDDASLRKVLQKATVYTEILGDIDVNMFVKYDFENSGILQPPAISLDQVNTIATYGSALYGTNPYNTTDSPVFRKNLIGSGFTAAFVFSGNDTRPTHRIDSFQIDYSVKGRR